MRHSCEHHPKCPHITSRMSNFVLSMQQLPEHTHTHTNNVVEQNNAGNYFIIYFFHKGVMANVEKRSLVLVTLHQLLVEKKLQSAQKLPKDRNRTIKKSHDSRCHALLQGKVQTNVAGRLLSCQ